MTTLAVLPIKSFGAAKQRLAGALGGGSRQALAQAMFSDVLASLRRVRGLDGVVVVTGDPAAESVAGGGRVIVLRDRQEAGQSAAALIGIRHALVAGFERVLLVPGDAPLIDAGELGGLLARAEERGPGVTIVPDRHEAGTNALLLHPPDVIAPSFGPGSLTRHLAAAREAGVPHLVDRVPSLLLDVDAPEDLTALTALLERRRGLAPMTRGTLRQLDRLRVDTESAGTSEVPAAAARA